MCVSYYIKFQHRVGRCFYAPLEKGGILFCNCRSVGTCISVGLSVCRPSVVHSISFDPFTWSKQNLVQRLPSMSRWSLLIFRSHVQRSRSNHSFQPSVLSVQYLLTPWLDQCQTCSRGCPQWVDDPYWFSGHMFKGRQTSLVPTVLSAKYLLTPSLDLYQTRCRGCP